MFNSESWASHDEHPINLNKSLEKFIIHILTTIIINFFSELSIEIDNIFYAQIYSFLANSNSAFNHFSFERPCEKKRPPIIT
jgi:hypothetical protein